MTLVQSWIDSLQLLKPKNLQLFVMVTLKSIIEAYKLMFKYFWWLLVLQLICYAFLYVVPIVFWYFILIIAGIQSLLFFMVCAITRPSIVKKDCAYFRSQLYPFMYFALFQVILLAIGYLFNNLLSISALPLPFFAWTIFFILFFLDSEKNVKNFFMSMWYAAKMILFNLPIVLCIYAAIYLFDISIIWLVEKCINGTFNLLMMLGLRWRMLSGIGIIGNIVPLLLLPIGICTYANIYIKKLHDQFDLYIKQPQ